jgi:CRP-like cAMP-binding protein
MEYAVPIRNLFLFSDMTVSADLRETLRRSVLFRKFTQQEMNEFLQLLEPLSAKAGEIIVPQDEVGDSMFIVAHGICRVLHHKGGRDVELAILREGDFFGELALIDKGPRSADVIAISDVELLKVSQSALAAFSDIHPAAGYKLLMAIGGILVDRLRLANERYVDSLLFIHYEC